MRRADTFNRKPFRKHVPLILLYAANTLVSVVFLFPLIFLILSAFNPENTMSSINMTSFGALFPKRFTFDNIIAVFTKTPIVRLFGNTVLYAMIAVAGVLIVNSMAGYALAKISFTGKKFISNFIIMVLIIPFEGITFSLYMILKNFGMINTIWAVTLPSFMSCFYIFMFRQFFVSVPTSIIEAAEIDGANPFKIYFSIVVPTATSVFITVFILEFIAKWSDYYWTMLVLGGSESMYNLQLGITVYIEKTFSQDWGAQMALLTVATLPLIILFLCLQKYYIEGIATQGIKDM